MPRCSLRPKSYELRADGQLIIALMLDRDGLQVAYLGVALAHYLDLESGEILDLPLDAPPPGDAEHFPRIPTRTPETEIEDRQLFLQEKQSAPLRVQLEPVVHDAMAYRQVLSIDRRVERSFFNFKADRAAKAIEEWIVSEGLSD